MNCRNKTFKPNLKIHFSFALVTLMIIISACTNDETSNDFEIPSWHYETLNFNDGLMRVIGIDGTSGYVTLEDHWIGSWHGWEGINYVNDFDDWTIEEHEAYVDYMIELVTEMANSGERYLWRIPLYAEDGVTVIGEHGFPLCGRFWNTHDDECCDKAIDDFFSRMGLTR